MKYIFLTGKAGKGRRVLVDNEDYEKVSGHRWYLHHTGYAYGRPRKGDSSWAMHRIIMCPPQHLQIDHLNHNKLDNRRLNLRICDAITNSSNRIKKPSLKKRYRKIKDKVYGPYYEATIRFGGKSHYVFSTNEDWAQSELDNLIDMSYI